MMCLGFEPGAAGWQAQTKPWSYDDLAVVSSSVYGKHLFSRRIFYWNLVFLFLLPDCQNLLAFQCSPLANSA